MFIIKINKSKEKMIGGAGDFKSDSEFDPELLNLAIDKEISDHGIDKERAKEVAKDEFTLDKKGYSKELKKEKKELSAYWKKRKIRRSKRANRGYNNKKDKSWAENQQERSEKINEKIIELFENDLELSEEISNNIDEYLKKIKEQKKSMFKIPKSFGKNKKPKGSISVPLGPEYGGVVKGYKKKLKKLKKKGMVGVAPGEAFGPAEE